MNVFELNLLFSAAAIYFPSELIAQIKEIAPLYF